MLTRSSSRASGSRMSPMGSSRMLTRSASPFLSSCSSLQLTARKRAQLSNPEGRSYHLNCSPHNPGAQAVAKEIADLLRKAKLPPLVWTDNMDHLEACEHILVHLDSTTILDEGDGLQRFCD
eukprot:2303003-Prymnesium_polylepis.2